MKVYLTYEINGGDLVWDCDGVSDTNCFSTLNGAIEHTILRILQGVESGFLPDLESEEIYNIMQDKAELKSIFYYKLHKAIETEFKSKHKVADDENYFNLVLFDGSQENWDRYYTIVIEAKELY